MPNLVLIAEDEVSSKTILKKIAESEGLSVIQANTGLLAWNILQDNPDIKLLITDIKMPELDGEELVKRIRNDEHLKHIPIIIVSGVVKISEISHMLESGASRFLAKPINVEHLRDYIRAALR